ncbi:hypothetical protein ITP53_53835 [Nonomuraea sp. K274]|uniref:Lipoprotein n=1 Tax=Nonomuraea cypriaca TaxID=1187855 RepID=A0A931APV3_9ACTN|nr:hypothetical protein [Nonomuraea cypriaca]MBF8194399.1 hypothetical protein [Nonomuraea cypriaca]
MRIRYALAAAVLLVTAACGGATTDKDAAGIVADLATHGLPVKVTVTYTEDSDPNKLLGRPNGYLSKAAFSDSRVKADGAKEGDVTAGGGVEVFADADAAEQRVDYIQAIASKSPMFGEYTYAAGNVVVRVSKELGSSDAAAYETALGEIVQ